MRSASVSAASQRRKQEEQNALEIRKILAESSNKFCFECGQRGPTYINLTIGSTSCAHCSGLLRGLNPPHRVKSISMSVFTSEDVERLKSLGNKVNAQIWLGLYDGRTKFEPRVDDEVRSHLIDKYENKRWYVSPSDLEQQKRLLEDASSSNRRNSLSAVSTNSQKSNQSAPAQFHFAQHQAKPGPIDLLTGDLFDLNVSSSPQTPQPSTPALVAAKPPPAADDWSSLFDAPAPQPAAAFPLKPPEVPAALKFPAPTIPPPKPKDTLDDLFSLPSNPPANATTSVPQQHWEAFASPTAAMPKSATVSGLPSNQMFDDFFGLEGAKPNGNPKPRSPVPASGPVAAAVDPFGSTPPAGNPPIQWPSASADSSKQDGKQWNPFL